MTDVDRPDRQVIRKTKLILVEGRDEELFFDTMLEHLQRTDVQVVQVGGKNGFRAMLAAIRNEDLFEDIRSILLVRDADWQHPEGTNARAAWDALMAALRHARLPQPSAHGVLQGVSATSNAETRPGAASAVEIRTAVYVMPDGTSDGMLEDLCLRAMRQDAAMPCLDSYFNCLKTAGFEHATKAIAKARAHAFLASRNQPDLRIGEAAKRRYWPFDAEAFKPLVDLLRTL
jgi:hypothetical protein